MKLVILLMVLGVLLLLEGVLRIATLGWPGLSGIALALPCFYFGIKRIRRLSRGTGKN